MSDERAPEQSTPPEVGLKPPPPFKRAAGSTPASPFVALSPSRDSNESPHEPPSTLLFNDLSNDALTCDPNDPDCEIV